MSPRGQPSLASLFICHLVGILQSGRLTFEGPYMSDHSLCLKIFLHILAICIFT